MQTIPTGDPDSLHPEDESYLKRWKETAYNTYLQENPHTGHLTRINSPQATDFSYIK
jgi:hypothetical protein